MRYRLLDSKGDYSFGLGRGEFLVNSPETVAQAVKTRMSLFQGEWFIDQDAGLPLNKILGENTTPYYDATIQERILETQGVSSITSYSSSLNGRALTVEATIDTIYGTVNISSIL